MISETIIEQKQVEKDCLSLLNKEKFNVLHVDTHITYLKTGIISKLPHYFSSLDASRTWLLFWILHSLELLNGLNKLDISTIKECINFLKLCQNNEEGGFGGGPNQNAHLAPTYAAVMAICILAKAEQLNNIDITAYSIINKKKLINFIENRRIINGGYTMCNYGEQDIRACYCAISVASICNILTTKMTDNLCQYIGSCQTYEGGFGGENIMKHMVVIPIVPMLPVSY